LSFCVTKKACILAFPHETEHFEVTRRLTKRTYESTHPWLTFKLNMGEASPELWMLMGEAQSKCEHVAGIPLLPAVHAEFLRVYLIKGAQATTAIEGNTLTEAQIGDLLDDRLTLPPSQEYQQQEVANILEGYKFLASRILEEPLANLSLDDLREYNRLILKDTPLGEDVIPGEIRMHAVLVGTVYRGAPPEDCEYLLARLYDWLNNTDGSFEAPLAPREVAFEILKAVVAHLYLAWIHPFGDGNGRTARMVEFEILLRAGIPAVSAHLLSNHYNKTRSEYYRQLQLSSSTNNPMGFIHYAFQGFVDELRAQIEVIKEQQIDVHWRDYVNDMFRDLTTATAQRRRNLLFDLSAQAEPVKVSKVRYISPRMAEAYASRGWRAIDRDLKELIRMGLVESTPQGYRARKDIMLAFRSPTRAD
jgi:Fic family protein